MTKLKSVIKQTNNKHLNLFKATYQKNGIEFDYYIASRKQKENLALLKSEIVADAVRILPYTKINGKTKIVLIKEYRYAINKHIYSIPAGLVDKGEDYLTAAKRELKEEVGCEILNIYQTEKASYTLAGLTDESNVSFEAEIKLCGKQKLGEKEDIQVVLVNFDEILDFIENNSFGLISLFQLKAFYYKNKDIF